MNNYWGMYPQWSYGYGMYPYYYQQPGMSTVPMAPTTPTASMAPTTPTTPTAPTTPMAPPPNASYTPEQIQAMWSNYYAQMGYANMAPYAGYGMNYPGTTPMGYPQPMTPTSPQPAAPANPESNETKPKETEAAK